MTYSTTDATRPSLEVCSKPIYIDTVVETLLHGSLACTPLQKYNLKLRTILHDLLLLVRVRVTDSLLRKNNTPITSYHSIISRLPRENRV